MFDQRLNAKVIKLVDVSYGGENGFNQAIDLCGEVLEVSNSSKKSWSKYFDEISMDTGKFCFGVDDTIKAMELGVETLIVWENLDINRFLLTNPSTGSTKILYLNPAQEKLRSLFLGQDEKWRRNRTRSHRENVPCRVVR